MSSISQLLLRVDRRVLALLGFLTAAESLVSLVTWYGVQVFGGREANVVFGYSTSIEVGRPILAFLFGVLLMTVLRRPSYSVVAIGALLGFAMGDLSYDFVYIVSRAVLPGAVVALVVSSLTLFACASRVFDVSSQFIAERAE